MNNNEIDMFKELFTYYHSILRDTLTDDLDFGEDCNRETLIRLVCEAIKNTEKYPSHKLHRWLGFVQGILTSIGEITVSEERERTRPIFHEIYGVGASFDATSI